MLRYLATHNDHVRASDGRPWVKGREIVEALAEKLGPVCIGRDVGDIIKRTLAKYTKYCDSGRKNAGCRDRTGVGCCLDEGWIALRDEVVEEANGLVRAERRTSVWGVCSSWRISVIVRGTIR